MANLGDTVISKVLGKSGVIRTKSGVSDGRIYISPIVAPYAGAQATNQIALTVPPEWIVYRVRWADGSISEELRDTDFTGPGDFGGVLGKNLGFNQVQNYLAPSQDTLLY